MVNETTQEQVKMKITPNMTIGDIVAKYPSAVEVLLSNGVHCVGCHVKYWESLEDGLRGHGMADEKIQSIIRQLNEAVANEEEPGQEGKDFIVSKRAADKLLSLMQREKKDGYGLRISIIPGGCSGYSYGLEFDKDATENDLVVEDKGVRILIEKESIKLIKGAKMDFVDTLEGSGFKITNPNAVDTCGCGQSFR